MRERRVGALDCTSPKPSDDCQLLPHIRLQIRTLGSHLRCDSHLWIQVSDALLRLLAHPNSIAPYILRQPLRSLPTPQLRLLSRLGVDRRHPRKLRRDLDHGLVDQHSDRVQIRRVRLQPQPLGLQGNGPAPCEGVMQSRHLVRVEQPRRLGVVLVQFADLPPGATDLGPRLLQHHIVGGVLPLHQLADQLKQVVPPLGEAAALLEAGLLAGVLVFPQGGRVVDQLAEDDRPRRRQGTAGPPQVQGAGVTVPDGLLPRRRRVDIIQRQRHFDELLGGLHGVL